jgi:integrase/recombinase XerD
LIRDYSDFLTQEGFSRITVPNALAWACLPVNTSARWRNQRLAVVRLFAAHLHAGDPGPAELIPAGLLSARVARPAPYLYSPDQVAALIDQAQWLTPALRGHTLPPSSG